MPSVKKATFWSYASQFTSQGLTFVISVILARLLTPEIFGIMGMALIVVEIGNKVKGFGLGASIIQRQDLDRQAYSSIFYFQLLAGLVFTGIIILIAPFIADFFDESRATKVIQAVAVIFLFHSLAGVPSALISKEMQYKKLVKVNFASLIIGGGIGIWMATTGYGIWSLVAYHTIKLFLHGLLVFFVSRWIPAWHFKWRDVKQILPFSMGMYGSTVITGFLSQMNRILLGRFMPAAQLGFFNKARGIRKLPEQFFYQGINQVSFPLFSKHQHNDSQLRSYMNRMQKLLAFVFAPTMIFIFVLAEPLIITLLGDHWVNSVIYLKFLAAAGIVGKVSSVNVTMIQAKGHSQFTFRYKLIEGVISTIVLIICLQQSLTAFLVFIVVRGYINFFLQLYFAQYFLNLPIIQQIKNFYLYVINGILSGSFVYLFLFITAEANVAIQLFFGAFSGTIFYLLLNYIQKTTVFNYLQSNISLFITNKK